jgi:hypothetical protein
MSGSAKRFWTSWVIVGAMGMAVTVTIVFLALLSSSFVEGEEFSPDDFSRRQFDYVQLPWLKWVLKGIEYRDVSSDIEKSLVSEGWISTTPAKNWHLCREFYGSQPAECDARFLVDLLNLKSQKPEFVYYWQEWNENHPDLAKIFWPMIADVARDEMYLIVPELMQLAMEVDTNSGSPRVDVFERQLHEFLTRAYQRFAEADQASDRVERAEYRLQRAAGFPTK